MATYTGTWDHDHFVGTRGNDTFLNIAGGDTVDGGLGDDTISVDLSYTDVGVTWNAIKMATTTGDEPLWYMSVKNVEHLGTIKTGSGKDSLTISAAQGNFTWNAGDNIDILKLDLSNATSARTTGMNLGGTAFEVHVSSSNALTGTVTDVENAIITGSNYNDQLGGTNGNDTITGGLGDDTLWASGGVDDLDGGAGFDRFVGYTYTGSANITYDATKAATSVGYSLADLTWVHNVESFYSLTTGAGNDTVMVNTAQKDFSWVGNGGINTLIADYSTSTGGVTTAWAPTTKFGPTLTLHTVEMGSASANTYMTNALKILGSAYGDNLHGTDGADSLYGQGGNDTLDPGMYAADIIDGGAGDDIVNINYSLETHDIAYNAVAASNNTGATLANGAVFRSIEHLGTMTTGSGNDTLTISAVQGAFTWHAGAGSDTLALDLSAATAGRYTTNGLNGYTVGSSAASLADLGTATDIEHVQITGSKYNDWLSGTAGSDTLLGGVGDDTLSGGGGVDVIDGGTGFDRVVNLNYSAATGGVTYDATQAAATTGFTLSDGTVVRNVESFALTTGEGNDTVNVTTAQKDFTWIANGGTDTLVADYSASKAGITVSLITGTPLGTDLRIQTTEMGTAHADAYMLDALSIKGSIYADNISGTAGNDTLNGYSGSDTLTGGGGQDVFLFGTGSGKDTITDFHAAENDTIDVHAYAGIHATITQHGTDAWIDFGNGNVITVVGASATDPAFLSHIVW